MYLPSTAPLPPNSQAPNTRDLVRATARVNRIAMQMARGRQSNLQRQTDYAQGCGAGVSLPDFPSGSPASSPVNWVSAMQSLFQGVIQPRGASAPIVPTMPSIPGVVSGPTTPVPAAPTAARQLTASNPSWTAAEKQAILDAPDMVPLEVAKVTCSSQEEDAPVNTYPRSSPPWANAVVTTGQGNSGFDLGSWVCEHPWLSLLIAGVAGVAIKSASE